MPRADESDDRAAAIRSLEAELVELLSRIRRVIAENANRVSPGMLPGAYKVLTTIAGSGEITSSALAERMLMDKGQLSRTIRELEQLGLLERSADPADGRSSLLKLTPEGIDRLRAARQPHEKVLLRRLQDWSVDDIGTLSRLLHALAAGERPDR